jgi:hypothetical protein
MRIAGLALLLGIAACARTPYAWQNPATGELAPVAVIEACHAEAQLEANRSAFLYGWGGPWAGFGWGRGAYWPGWGFGPGLGSVNLAIIQRTQELTAFCMRLKGYAWLPLRPTSGLPQGDAAPAEAKP